MLKCGIYFTYSYLYIYSALILYTNCIHNSYTFCRLELMYTKCIPHFGKLLYIFCIQSLAATVLLTLYTARIQTLVNMWDTCYIHFVYISCMHLLGSSRAQWVTGAKLVTLRLMSFSPSYTGVAIKSCQRLLSKNNENLSCFVTVTL